MSSSTYHESRQTIREQLRASERPTPRPHLRDMEGEAWAGVPGYAGRYRVSTRGRVLRMPVVQTTDVRLWHPLLLSPTFSGGYFWVFLRAGRNSRKLYRLDRIMLCAFAGKPLEVFDVGYRNGDRCDLRLENLERLNTITVLGPPTTRRRLIEDDRGPRLPGNDRGADYLPLVEPELARVGDSRI